MTTVVWTRQPVTLVLMLGLSALLVNLSMSEQASGRIIEPFKTGCVDYGVLFHKVVTISNKGPLSKMLDCQFTLKFESFHHLEYLVDDANFVMCGVALSIYDGSSTSPNSLLHHFDCKTAVRLPIRNRTSSNEVRLVLQKSEFGPVDLTFNMTVISDMGPVHLLDKKDPLKKEYDICHPDTVVHHPPTIYLPKPGYHSELYIKLHLQEPPGRDDKCLMVVKTCAECQVGLEIMDPPFNFVTCAPRNSSYIATSKCIDFTFYDGDYKEQTIRTITASYMLQSYSSETKHLYVQTHRYFPQSTPTDRNNVIARFRVFSKMKYRGISRSGAKKTFELTSPFFPDPCIQNGETYTIVIGSKWDDYFLITFDDWMMPHDAWLRYPYASRFNTSGWRKRGVVYAREKLVMTFNPGSYRQPGTYFAFPGFKATVTFNNGSLRIPVTDCDMVVDDEGGMVKLDSSKMNGMTRDCIWLVKKPVQSRGVFLTRKIVRYIDPSLKVEVREGLTSAAPLRYELQPHFDRYHLTSSLTTSGHGFYIRFTGRLFATDSPLVFHYAAFSYNCHAQSIDLFRCDNARCISIVLRCDGVDHCGDGSDESEKGCRTDSTDDDGIDSHLRIGFVVPLVVSLIVIIFFCIFLVSLQRCYRLRLQRLPPGHHGQSSSSTSANRTGRVRRRRQRRWSRSQSVQMSVTVTSGEHPPSYNEVMMSAPPLSNVNVAFSFSPGDEFPMSSPPPSYGEAIQADNFDLSTPSDSREEVNRNINGSSTLINHLDPRVVSVGNTGNQRHNMAESTFITPTRRTAQLPPYTQTADNSGITATSTNAASSLLGRDRHASSVVVPVLSAINPSVAPFDPATYVSSSSSSDCYDDEDGRGYRFDSPTTTDDDDDDDDGNSLFAQALSLVSVESSYSSNCLRNTHSNTTAPVMSPPSSAAVSAMSNSNAGALTASNSTNGGSHDNNNNNHNGRCSSSSNAKAKKKIKKKKSRKDKNGRGRNNWMEDEDDERLELEEETDGRKREGTRRRCENAIRRRGNSAEHTLQQSEGRRMHPGRQAAGMQGRGSGRFGGGRNEKDDRRRKERRKLRRDDTAGSGYSRSTWSEVPSNSSFSYNNNNQQRRETDGVERGGASDQKNDIITANEGGGVGLRTGGLQRLSVDVFSNRVNGQEGIGMSTPTDVGPPSSSTSSSASRRYVWTATATPHRHGLENNHPSSETARHDNRYGHRRHLGHGNDGRGAASGAAKTKASSSSSAPLTVTNYLMMRPDDDEEDHADDNEGSGKKRTMSKTSPVPLARVFFKTNDDGGDDDDDDDDEVYSNHASFV